MALHKCLNNFTGGEISPQLDARIDLQKYETSCRKLENVRPLPWGGAQYRHGTLFLAACKYADRPCRLIPFKYSTTINYVIELGDLYMRFFRDGARVESPPGTPVEIAAPYTASEVFAVQFKEINDVMYLVHPDHAPQKLVRASETSWSIGEVVWRFPALMDENADEDETLRIAVTTAGAFQVGGYYEIVTVGSTNFMAIGAATNTVGEIFQASGAGAGTGTALLLGGGGATMIASSSRFTADHVGSYWELKHQRDATKVELDLSVTTPGTTHSDAIKVKGDWTFVTTERWWGQLYIERSEDFGVTWKRIRAFTSAADRNVNASGTQETEALFRLTFICAGDPYATPPWTGTPPSTYVKARASFEVADAYVAGLVLVTAFTNATTVTVYILQTVTSSEATDLWSEGAWSDERGWPRTVGLFEQRLYFAGTATKPNTVWGSVVADFENFAYSDLDDAAVAYQFAAAQQNPINWLHSLVRMYAGTSGGEHIVASGDFNEPLTPSNVVVRDPSSYGSEYVQPVKIGNEIVFLERQSGRIRALREPGRNPLGEIDSSATDLTLFAEHLASSGITQFDYAKTPDPVVFAVRGTRLIVLTYLREQNVAAWCQYSTAGSFESIACVNGSPSDVVYVVTNRTVGGATVRYVEVFTSSQALPASNIFMDSAVQAFPAGTTVTGLSHLEGLSVAVLADGAVVEGLTVSGGQITLPQAANIVNVGLSYTGRLWPMKIDAMLSNGTSQGRKRRISELAIRFKDSGGAIQVGNSGGTSPQNGIFSEATEFRQTTDAMDTAVPLYSGDYVVQPWQVGADFEAEIQITQLQPLPMHILGLFIKAEVFGE